MSDAVVAVQRNSAQMHDGRCRQRDVTSSPDQTRVETEVPVAKHLHTRTHREHAVLQRNHSRTMIA